MNKLNKNNLILIESRFRSVQKNIDKKLNSLNKKPFQRSAENWNRKQGGGGKSISINGDVIEKAAAFSMTSPFMDIDFPPPPCFRFQFSALRWNGFLFKEFNFLSIFF